MKDNRRFDSSGNERGEDKPAAKAASQQKPAAARSEAAVQPEVEGEGGDEFRIDFSSFVISLATQALMQLGQMKAPDGVELPVDRNAARQTIDILSMLQEKTRGNLEPAEAQLIEDILHNLRLSFIKVA